MLKGTNKTVYASTVLTSTSQPFTRWERFGHHTKTYGDRMYETCTIKSYLQLAERHEIPLVIVDCFPSSEVVGISTHDPLLILSLSISQGVASMCVACRNICDWD